MWRIVDHIIGQRFRIRLGHGLTRLGYGSIVLINNFKSQQRKKEEGERRWEAVEFRWFQTSSRREKGEEGKMRIGMRGLDAWEGGREYGSGQGQGVVGVAGGSGLVGSRGKWGCQKKGGGGGGGGGGWRRGEQGGVGVPEKGGSFQTCVWIINIFNVYI